MLPIVIVVALAVVLILWAKDRGGPDDPWRIDL